MQAAVTKRETAAGASRSKRSIRLGLRSFCGRILRPTGYRRGIGSGVQLTLPAIAANYTENSFPVLRPARPDSRGERSGPSNDAD
jgi:hypothetical protein